MKFSVEAVLLPAKRIWRSGLIPPLALLAAVSAYFWIRAGVLGVGFLDEDFLFLNTGSGGLRAFLIDVATPHAIGTFRPWGHQMHFFLGRLLFGLSPKSFHLVQLALHMANTILVFLLFRQLSETHEKNPPASNLSFGLAWMATLAWSIRSSFGSTLAWVAATNNAWFLFFFLLFLLGYLREWSRIVVIFSFFMALMSKEFAVLAVPVALCLSPISFWRKQKRTLFTVGAMTIFFFVYLKAVKITFSHEHEIELSANTWNAFRSYLAFVDVGFFGAWPTPSSAPWVLAVLAGACAWLGGWRQLLVFVGSLLFLSCWPRHVRSEFLYLPLVGLFGALYAIGDSVVSRWNPSHWAAGAVLVPLAIVMVPLWKENLEFATDIAHNFRDESVRYARSDEMWGELERHLAENADSPFWSKLNETLGERGIIYTSEYLQVMHPRLLGTSTCSSWRGVDVTNPRLTPDLFFPCEPRAH